MSRSRGLALSIDEIKQMIPGMLQTAWKPQDSPPEYEPGPATLEEIRRFEADNGMVLSKDVIDWMLMTNGIFRGPAGLNGVSGYMSIGVEGAFTQFPEWKSRNWFPLAEDGCGNFWVSYPIDRYPDRRPVGFVNTVLNTHRIQYIVASSAWHFLYFLLTEDSREDDRWPGDRDYVVELDPMILTFPELTTPWNDHR
jgi:hypothetical protein